MKRKSIPKLKNALVGDSQLPKSERGYDVCEIAVSSPFQNSRVFFNIVNTEFPRLHEHSHWEILLVAEGKILHRLNGKESVLSKGDGVILRPKDVHNLTFVDGKKIPCQHITFGFDNEFAEQLFSLYEPIESMTDPQKTLSFFLSNDELSALMEKLLYFQTLDQKEYEQSAKLLINSLVIQFFEQRANVQAQYPDWLKQFLNYVNNPRHLDQPISALAKHTPYSYTQLSRLFKEYFGVTLSQYVLNIKMMYAKRLLRTTDMTILQISSAMLYYDSLSTFNHNFKKVFSVTPSEYRKAGAPKNQDSPSEEK